MLCCDAFFRQGPGRLTLAQNRREQAVSPYLRDIIIALWNAQESDDMIAFEKAISALKLHRRNIAKAADVNILDIDLPAYKGDRTTGNYIWVTDGDMDGELKEEKVFISPIVNTRLFHSILCVILNEIISAEETSHRIPMYISYAYAMLRLKDGKTLHSDT